MGARHAPACRDQARPRGNHGVSDQRRVALPARTQRFAFGEITSEADRAVLEWRVQGIASATGERYDNAYCGVFRVRAGRIFEVREYLDSLHAAQVLFGAMAPAEVIARRARPLAENIDQLADVSCEPSRDAELRFATRAMSWRTKMPERVDTTTPQLGRYLIDTGASAATFRTRHMFGLGTVRGTVGIRTGTVTIAQSLAESSVYAQLDAASFHTRNGRRDRSVRSERLLNAAWHPVITFRADGLKRATISGTLTVRDLTRPVTLTVEQSEILPDAITGRATTRIDRTDFGVTAYRRLAARYLDVTVEVRCYLAGSAHI